MSDPGEPPFAVLVFDMAKTGEPDGEQFRFRYGGCGNILRHRSGARLGGGTAQAGHRSRGASETEAAPDYPRD
ncbi:hypothetical protein [Mesorhizobium sp. 128a]